MKKKIQTTKVFKEIREKEAEGYQIIKLQGGSRSSKTWSILQFFIAKALQGEKFDLTITRESLQLAKDTVLRDFAEMVEKYELPVTPDVNHNRPSQIYKILDGEFIFWGLDKPKRAHGRKQKYTWMNEVVEIGSRKAFDQLEMRTEGLMILDYNPSDEDHWVFDLDARDDVVTLRSTVLNNPFIGDKQRRKILGYEPTEENIRQGTADNYMWEVYGLGNPAKLQGVIFENWEIVDAIPEGAEDLGLGLDFGYTNHPTALVEVFKYNNEIWLNELIYEKGLKNHSPDPEERTIASLMTQLEIGSREITGDSAEPKSIDELYNCGFNITGAKKGTDSVNFGIDLMKGYKINVTKRSQNLIRELKKYKWAEDKNGKSLNKPVKEFDHALDASRYRIMDTLGNVFEVELYPSGILG